MMSIFNEMDERLRNIEALKGDYFNESCILIFAYLDYLSNFTEKINKKGNNNHRENFRYFIKNYSNLESELMCLQIDKFYNDYSINRNDEKNRYEHYFKRIELLLDQVRKGQEVPLNKFFTLDDVDEIDKDYFKSYTIFNKIYDHRNFLIHEYRNNLDYGGVPISPFLSYTENIQGGRVVYLRSSILFSEDFTFKLLYKR